MSWAEYYNEPVTMERFVSNVTGFLKPYIDAIRKYGNGKRGLEAGCAEGLTSIYLTHLGYDIVGVDNDKDILRKAREANRYLRGSARFVCTDLFRLHEIKGRYEFCFSQGVLEHFPPDKINKLLDIQLSISPRVIFSVPSMPYKRKDYGDENLWSYAQWEKILERYKIVHSFGFHAKVNQFQAVMLFPLLFIAPKLREILRKRFYDTQLCFIIESKLS